MVSTIPVVRLILLILSILVVSCGTRSQMLNMWVDPDYPPGPMKKLLVVGLWENAAAREVWENAFARALAKNDAVAVPSLRFLPSAMPDSTAIFEAARRAGFDGVVAVYETYENTKLTYVAGYVTREVRVIDDGYRIFCKAAYDRTPGHRVEVIDTYYPGYYAAETSVRCDVEVWTAPDDVRMVWTGTTDMEMMEPVSDGRMGGIVAGWVEWEMLKCGLIYAGGL